MKKLIFIVLFACSVNASIYYVDQAGTADFTTIQAAVYAASDNDEIIVRSGIYIETVEVTNSLYIHSINPDNASIVSSTIVMSNNRNYSNIFNIINYSVGLQVKISGFTITNAKHGIYNPYDKNFITVNKNVIAGNKYGISIHNGIISSNVICNNEGGLYNCSDGTIQHNTIFDNSSGISSCDGTIQYNTISDNNGSGISSCGGTIQYNSIFNNNSGIENCHNGVIQYNTISNNLYSGCINCQSIIQNNKIVNNKNSGVRFYNSHYGIVRNNLIADNMAQDYGGGIFFTDNDNNIYPPTIINNTIVRNFAPIAGGGIYCGKGNFGIFNCIVWGNMAAENRQINNAIIPQYSCIEGYIVTNNCTYENPDFLGENDFRISEISPCKDAGFNFPEIWYQKDLDGSNRVHNFYVDMGCYEAQAPEPEPAILSFLILSFTCFYRFRFNSFRV